MKSLAKAALAGTAMTAALVMGAGTASAATIGGPAGTGTPSAAYQVCGTAYVGGDAHVSAPPAGALGVGGVKITGTLVPGGGSWSTTTAADGTWCLTGDANMATTVKNGGRVDLTFDTPTVSNGMTTYTGHWSGAGTDASLDAFDFFDHAWPSPSFTADRAWKVNVYYQ
ncbi:hypothetical protein [Prescottella agglutinans]|uniref:hypothetical protein n=1 Tax=Prescottella agglutinans TaxID=1644129 RepID=UPI003D960C45